MDFSYEVSRSLASCEGAMLVVDASQGVEAQTLANAYIAINHGLETIPVINKIDLPSADVERTKEMIEGAIGLDASHALLISAKTGQGVPEVLEAIVKQRPAAEGPRQTIICRRCIFDSWFDSYRGVVVLARVIQGTMRQQGQRIRLMVEWQKSSRSRRWACSPRSRSTVDSLSAGEVGFLTRQHQERCRHARSATPSPTTTALPSSRCPASKKLKPMVFAGLYTVDAHEHTLLREALEKLRLNDSSFFFEPESSVALGFGFRCGFLGLLHMEIIQERLEREYNLNLITTAPERALQDHAAPTAAWWRSTTLRAGPIPPRSPRSKSR